MNAFVRAVITGFGFSVGKALYDKVSERIFGESTDAKSGEEAAAEQTATSDDDAEPNEPS